MYMPLWYDTGTNDILDGERSQDVYMALENDLYGDGTLPTSQDYSASWSAFSSGATVPVYAEPATNAGASGINPYETP